MASWTPTAAVRDGVVIAATGQPLTPGDPELFTAPLLAVNGNSGGDYIVVGTTSNPDPDLDEVVVLNGEEVIARSGDQVDLGGAGPEPTDAFIESFAANDAFLSDDFNDDTVDDRELYVFAKLRDGRGKTLGDAVLVVSLAEDTCPWDLTGDGFVGVADMLALFPLWGLCPGPPGCPGDFNADGVVGVGDMLAMFSNWGPCP